MCGRYASFLPAEALAADFSGTRSIPTAQHSKRPGLAPDARRTRGAAAPAGPRARHLDLLRWGLIPALGEGPQSVRQPVNRRAESLATSAMFRDALARRRCLVPAAAFYEWQRTDGGKTRIPWAVARAVASRWRWPACRRLARASQNRDVLCHHYDERHRISFAAARSDAGHRGTRRLGCGWARPMAMPVRCWRPRPPSFGSGACLRPSTTYATMTQNC